ncbi:MAG: hypothetical protein IT384_09310 [Deltaproteobacteria bacterium]|nr:hypothetical protein [Deltaproteobacteria bacterium]
MSSDRISATQRAQLPVQAEGGTLRHLVTQFVREIANKVANVKDPERSTWVADHLIAVSGADPNSRTISMEQFKKGLEGMGLNDAAVITMVAAGTPLQVMSSGKDLYTEVDLDKAGRNHPGASSGVLLPGGGISEEGLKYLKMFQTTVDPLLGDVLTGENLKTYHLNRVEQIKRESKGLPIGERIRNWVGANIVMSGEFGPFLAVAGVPNSQGELVLPLARLDELYNHKIFYRVRAEHDAAALLLKEHDGKLGPKPSVPEFLATFAKMQKVEIGTKEQLLDFARTVLRERNPKVYGTGAEISAAKEVRAQLAASGLPDRAGLDQASAAHGQRKVPDRLVQMAAQANLTVTNPSDLATEGARRLIDNPLDTPYLESVLNPRGVGGLLQATAMLVCPYFSGSVKVQGADPNAPRPSVS